MRKLKMKGAFCDEVKLPKGDFAKGSFRWRKSPRGQAWLMFACLKGKWAKSSERCRKGGLKLVKLRQLVHKGERCPKGATRIVIGR